MHDRHRKWSAGGTWERNLRAVQADADTEDRIDWSMAGVGSTSCRAHQAAGARTAEPHALDDAADQFNIVQMRPWGAPVVG